MHPPCGGLARSFQELALLYARTGEASRAAPLVGAAEVQRAEIVSPLPPRFRDAWQALIDRLKARLGEQTFARERREGRDSHLDRAVRLARLEI